MGMNWRLAFAVASASLSAFIHGYNAVAVKNVIIEIDSWLYHETADGQVRDGGRYFKMWISSVYIFALGSIIGAMVSGVVADRFGRKLALLLSNIFVFVGALIEGFSKSANSIAMLLIGRSLISISSGLVSGLAPMYLVEISPASHRGCIGTVYNLVFYISLLFPGVHFGRIWPWKLAGAVVPALLQCLTLPFCPESPKFLLSNRGQVLRAQRALYWLQGDVAVHGDTETAQASCNPEPFEVEKSTVGRKVSLLDLFRNRQLRRPLLIAALVMAAQQLTGFHSITNIASDAFMYPNPARLNYVYIGLELVPVVTTVVSMFLVDRVGRRVLLLTGFSGMFVITVLLAVVRNYYHVQWVSYLCAVLIILFAVMYALGPASIPWFLVHELFNHSSRGTAASVAVTFNWIASFVFTHNFDYFHISLGHIYAFVIFAVLQVLFIVFIYFKVPETKRKTEEEISALFK